MTAFAFAVALLLLVVAISTWVTKCVFDSWGWGKSLLYVSVVTLAAASLVFGVAALMVKAGI